LKLYLSDFFSIYVINMEIKLEHVLLLLLFVFLFKMIMDKCGCKGLVEGLNKPTFPIENAITKEISDSCLDDFIKLRDDCWVNEGGDKDNPPPDFLCWYNSMDNKYYGHNSNDVSICENAKCKDRINAYVNKCMQQK
jgi:hypothetical protein